MKHFNRYKTDAAPSPFLGIQEKLDGYCDPAVGLLFCAHFNFRNSPGALGLVGYSDKRLGLQGRHICEQATCNQDSVLQTLRFRNFEVGSRLPTSLERS